MKSSALYSADVAGDSLESLLASHGPERGTIYWLLLFGVIGILTVLPLIHVDVAVKASGWVRPKTERTELRPSESGHVLEIFVRDNERVKAGQPLFALDTSELELRLARNRTSQDDKQALLADLTQLTAAAIDWTKGVAGLPNEPLRTAALQRDRSQFYAQLESHRLSLNKARNEEARYATLTAKGIATTSEHENTRYELERVQADARQFVAQNLSRWQTRLHDESDALADLVLEEKRLRESLSHYTLRAPTEGVILGFNVLAKGAFIGAGQTVGTLSPDDVLVVEAFVSPRDIGLVRVGQEVSLQVDAFTYTQWGMLGGAVESVSGDMVSGNGAQPGRQGDNIVFKVLVRPERLVLQHANGVQGKIRKGMTLTARFIVGRRSLLQLIYENLSGWMDPRTTAN